MRIITKAINIDSSESLEELIEEKIGGLKKFVQWFKETDLDGRKETIETIVEISRTTNHHQKGDVYKALVKIILPKKTLMAVSEREDIRTAIADVKKELEGEIKKYKTKLIDYRRTRR